MTPEAVPRKRSFWPDPLEQGLLTVAVGEPSAARMAWAEIRPTLDIEKMEVDTLRLLPLIYRRLGELGLTDPEAERLRGTYRHTWSRNQLLVSRLAEIVVRLRDRKVEAIALKGIASSLLYYTDIGTRPMWDVDILVHRSDVSSALDAMNGSADLDLLGMPPPRFIHGTSVRTDNDIDIDLHWRLSEYIDERASDELWDHARPFSLGDVEMKTLESEQHFIHLCAHGMTGRSMNVQWIVDGAVLLQSCKDSFDWDRALMLATRQGCSLAIRDAATYLATLGTVEIPPDVVLRFDRVRRTRREAIGYRATSRIPRGPDLLQRATAVAGHYTRTTATMSIGRAIVAFPSFLQESWRLRRKRDLPLTVLRKIWPRSRSSRAA